MGHVNNGQCEILIKSLSKVNKTLHKMLVKWPQIKQTKCQKGVHMISVNGYNFIANINPCKNNVYE